MAHDEDKNGTLNAQLTYFIVSQNPATPNTFSIDAASGRLQTLRFLQRKDQQVYDLSVRVSDPGDTHSARWSTPVNREVPGFHHDYLQLLSHRLQHRM